MQHRGGVRRIGWPAALLPAASVAGGWIHTGSITPHCPRTRALVADLRELPAQAASTLSRTPFQDIAAGAVRAQAWRTIENLRRVLEEAQSDLAHVVRLRVCIGDPRDESFVLEVIVREFGNALPALEIVHCGGQGLVPGLKLFVDAIAVACDAGAPRRVHAAPLGELLAPFPHAVIAGGLVFTSTLPPVDVASGRCPDTRLDLGDELRSLVRDLGRLTARTERFVCHQAQMLGNLLAVLEAAGTAPANVLHLHYWSGVSMHEMAAGTLTRLMDRYFGPITITSFPPAVLRAAGGLAEGSVVATVAAADKVVKLPRDPMTGAYVPAVQGRQMVLTAGEVPIDRAARKLIACAADLPPHWAVASMGRPVQHDAAFVKATYILQSLCESLAGHGAGLPQVVRQNVYLADASDSVSIELAARRLFGERLPPTCFIPVAGASPHEAGGMEIELIAMVQGAQ